MSDEPTCATCRRVMDPSEAKVFTVCDACWDDIYAKAAGSDSNHFREDARLRAYRDERDTARRDLAAARGLLERVIAALPDDKRRDCHCIGCDTRAFLAGLPTRTPSANVVTSSIVEAGIKLGTNSGGALDPATIEACAKVCDERLAHWREVCGRNIDAGCAPPQYDMGCRAEASTLAGRIRALEGKEGK